MSSSSTPSDDSTPENSITDIGINPLSIIGAASFILSIIGLLVIGLSESWIMGVLALGAVIVLGWIVAIFTALLSQSDDAAELTATERFIGATSNFFVGYFFVPIGILYMAASS